VRFLAQASWGARPEDIEPLVKLGFAAWVDAQRNQPISLLRPYLDEIRRDIDTNNPPQDQVPYARPRELQNTLAINTATAWMRNIVLGTDQLRQRIAWAFSQIMVTSYNHANKLNANGVAMADYYDTLAKHALGNFRDLLLAVSLHPVMAYYLSSLGNEKPDPARNQYPDENYAREVMQLFSIGLWELNTDGTQKLDVQKNPIPTYDNDDIENLARVFTGLWFEGKPWPRDASINFPSDWLSDRQLAMFEDQHDTAQKTLFHNKTWKKVLPARNTGLKDIEAAVDVLFKHPNTGPFIGKALIRFLVTSNPSPAYVRRVAAVFANNGAGVRGDLFAVVKAILLDTEARAAQSNNPNFGKLQEPLVRLARMVRAFNAGKSVPDLQFWSRDAARAFAQWPQFSPSVFNFFMPGYRHLGVLAQYGLASPEFQILDSVTVVSGSNKFAEFIDTLLHRRLVGGAPEFKFDFAPELALANTPAALIERLNLLLCAGRMSATTRQHIFDGVTALNTAEARVRFAVWLAAVSPEAAILK
jgi:uncharacterized protein (DUF1800 family)